MKKCVLTWVLVLVLNGVVWADTFGMGANQFTVDFVPISGATNPETGISGEAGFTFTGVEYDYRIAIYEIINDQWDKFVILSGLPTGNPSGAYDESTYWPGANIPVSNVSWYEAAQFVNWLNTSKGYHPAYRFTGTQGTPDYTFDVWNSAEAAGGTNLYRHKDAVYFIPTEDEWTKAGYWNGTELQDYATKDGAQATPGVDTNHHGVIGQPWDVGSGTEELNGTFDIMGNISEWMENPHSSGDFTPTAIRVVRGGCYNSYDYGSCGSSRNDISPYFEVSHYGFRVASVPEPCSMVLWFLGGLALIRKPKT